MRSVNANTEVWLQNLADERDGAALYDGLAQAEQSPGRAEVFATLATTERRHADLWAKKLERAGVPLPADRPSPRVRLLIWLARRLGTKAVLALVMDAEASDAAKYARQPGEDARKLGQEEQEHQQTLSGMRGPTAGGGASGAIAVRETWHLGRRSGSIRAAVFGMNDGLVSNFSLVLGVAGAGAAPDTLLKTGFAGMLAGACSMAVGEYLSVASQRDLLKRQIDLERHELAEAPQEEAGELAAIFQQKGLSEEQAARTTSELFKNPEAALDTLVREELGLDPDDLGSPFGAAGSSFVTFGLGAGLPLVPFFLVAGTAAIWASAGVAAVVLASVGGLLGFISGTSPLRSGARMLLLAAGAAGITFGLGHLVGASLG
jgi:VIT1/CCC1 family predicted Fe2+/Mn2+ transporter